MRTYLACLAISLLTLSASQSGSGGKHLFILSGQSNMARLNHQACFNPWVEKAFGKNRVIVVKDAMGSQPIYRWYKGWNPDQADTAVIRGELYDTLMRKVWAQIENNRIKTVTFVWMQGERDARMGWGSVYEESLRGLYRQLSEDLKRSDVNFVIGRLNDFDLPCEKYQHWNLVRAAQMKVGASDPRFTWVNTDDLNDGLNEQGKEIVNDLHLSVKGYEELGKRFAEGAIQIIRKHDKVRR